MSTGQGFVIVRDDGPNGALYLKAGTYIAGGYWTEDGSKARVFVTSKEARRWIRSKPAAYWLNDDAGRPRVISARAAGVTR